MPTVVWSDGPVAGRGRSEDVCRPAFAEDTGEGVLHPLGVVGDPVVGRVEELDRRSERGRHVRAAVCWIEETATIWMSSSAWVMSVPPTP